MVVPASVRELEDEAFCGPRHIYTFVFERGSKLKRIGVRCFAESTLFEITIPRGVTEIGNCAFYKVGFLERVTFAEGSVLEEIPDGCFEGT